MNSREMKEEKAHEKKVSWLTAASIRESIRL